MRRYRVEITGRALSELEEIVRYIADILAAPDTALRLYDRISETIASLDQFPARAPLVPFEPERSAGLRRINVGQYAIFYLIEEKSVKVTNVLYGRSDLEARIK